MRKIFNDEVTYKLKRLKVYDLAVANCTDTIMGGYEDVSRCFTWDDTPEGSDFWYEIYEKVENGNLPPSKNVVGGKILC